MTDLGGTLRRAVRTLARQPSFTVPVVLTLALGIGAATLMFSVVNGVLLRPLPYPDQDRLVEIVHAAPERGFDALFASPAIYFTYRDHSESFESIGLWDWDGSPATVIGSGEPESVPSLQVTHEVLDILGTAATLGRTFASTDDERGSTPSVVLSYGFWQRHFGGASALGRTLRVDGVAREIIGVLPEGFSFFEYPAEIVYPLQPRREAAAFPGFDGRAIARLKEGVTLDEANADVARMIPLVRAEFSAGAARDRFELVPRLRPLEESVVGDLGGTLWPLMGTVVALLLIACANVSNLALVRTEARQRDLVIRAALGAGWSGMVKLVACEAAVLVLAAATLGLTLAHAALPVVLAMGIVDLPEVMRIEIDGAVLGFTAAAALAAIAVLTLIPLLRAGHWSRSAALSPGRRSVGIEHESARTRHSLLVAQVAVALVLLVGSGLMIRTFLALRDVEPGFVDPGQVQTFQVALSEADAGSIEQAVRTHEAVLDRLAVVPGVERAAFAGFTDALPLDGDGRSAPIRVAGAGTGAPPDYAEVSFVSPGYFGVLGTALAAGRDFEWDDVYDRRRVALVSENLARAKWGSAAAAVGERITVPGSEAWFEVVGVTKDVRHNGLTQPAPESVSFPIPVGNGRLGTRTATFVVRSARAGTSAFVGELRRAVWRVNGNVSLANVRTLGALYEQSTARTSLALLVLLVTGSLALVLGFIGIYGVYSYAVLRRAHEIGVRMALGARQGQLRRMFLAHALALTGIGVAIGAVAALALTRLVSSQLFGVSPLDPPTYAASALMLVAAGVVASYLPARRASALDPQAVLTAE